MAKETTYEEIARELKNRIWLKNQQQKQDSKEIYVDVEEVKNEE